MSALAELLLAFIDVIKVNLEESKQSAFAFSLAVTLLGVAAVFLLAGAGLIVAGIYMGLSRVMEDFGAALITGGILLVFSGVSLWVAKVKARS